MEKFLKSPSETSSKKRKHSVNPSVLDKYGIAHVSGKGICFVCSIELAEESLKPNKLQRHVETHSNIAVLSEDSRKRIFHHRFRSLTKSQVAYVRHYLRRKRWEFFRIRQLSLLVSKSDISLKVKLS